MNLFKRAAISILKRSGKNVILLLLIFILGTVIAGAISVSSAINNTDANLRRRMRPIVSIDFDWDRWLDAEIPWDDIPNLTPERVRTIGALEYVDFYDYVNQGNLWSFDLIVYEDDSRWTRPQPGIPNLLNLHGTSRTELVQIDQGVIELIHGRQFQESELIPHLDSERSVAIISESFAEVNHLTLGSTFWGYLFVRFPDEDGNTGGEVTPDFFSDENVYARVEMELEVIGLFDKPVDLENPEIAPWIRARELNRIYVPNWVVESIDYRMLTEEISLWEHIDQEMPEWLSDSLERWAARNEEGFVESIFVLENPADLENFREAATLLLPSEFHYVADLFSEFDEISSSMATLQNVANWIVYGSLGATLLILSLLITLFLHDRRHEIGIYLSLGEKKGKIISQVLIEVVLIAVVGITLAVFAGHQISGVVSQNLLENELLALTSERDFFNNFDENTIFDSIGFPPITNMSPDEMMAAFHVSLSVQGIILFYAVGLGTVIASTAIPIIYVVMLNPKKVLL